MNVLLDSNILTRLAQHTHPMHATARDAVAALRHAGETLLIVSYGHCRPASELMPFGSGIVSVPSGQAQHLLQTVLDLLHGGVGQGANGLVDQRLIPCHDVRTRRIRNLRQP